MLSPARPVPLQRTLEPYSDVHTKKGRTVGCLSEATAEVRLQAASGCLMWLLVYSRGTPRP